MTNLQTNRFLILPFHSFHFLPCHSPQIKKRRYRFLPSLTMNLNHNYAREGDYSMLLQNLQFAWPRFAANVPAKWISKWKNGFRAVYVSSQSTASRDNRPQNRWCCDRLLINASRDTSFFRNKRFKEDYENFWGVLNWSNTKFGPKFTKRPNWTTTMMTSRFGASVYESARFANFRLQLCVWRAQGPWSL